MTKFAVRAAAAMTAFAVAAPAGAVVLYDGSVGTTPQSQGYLFYLPMSGAIETVANGVTTLNTSSDNAVRTGFSNDTVFSTPVNAAFPTLNPAAGFDLSFTAKLDAESNTTPNRSGFDVLLLGSDGRGIELAFFAAQAGQAAQVFALNSDIPTFSHAESTTGFDPTTGFHSYDLRVVGSSYTLTADGSQLLTGATRDYSAYGSAPYTLSNYLFLGDDTTSASATVELSRIAIAVPDPAADGLLGGTAATILACRYRRR